MATSKPWQEVAAEAQRYRDKSIESLLIQPPVPSVPESLPLDVTSLPRKLLSTEEVELTELAPEALVQKLASRAVSAVTVAQAFLRRAGLAQRLANCATELLAEAALTRAEELDTYLREHGRPMGALHGLPVSVKEHVSMAGRGLNLGYVSLYGEVAKEDAFPLQILREAGAVFYVRTTEPQTIMHLECSSNLYGVTANPHNTALSSGGSSGGEGALAALRGTCLGIGTDIGGSVRSPAGNCGVYGLRPTSFRLPYRGIEANVEGTGGVIPVQGPLSTSIEGIRMYCKAMLDCWPWNKETNLVPLPWKDVPAIEKGSRLKIGVIWHDDIVKPHPPIMRGMKEVVEGLKSLPGVEVFDFKAYKHDHAWDIISSLYFVDGAAGEFEMMEGEPLRPLTKWLLKEEGHAKRLSIEELWNWETTRAEYLWEYNQKWQDTGGGKEEDVMDVILCPYFPGASSVFDTAKYWAYTATWNLTDYPSLVFPVSKVDPEVDKVEEDFKPMTDKDAWNHSLYDPDTFKGAPVSLQLVARRYEEEKLVAIADYVVKSLNLPGPT